MPHRNITISEQAYAALARLKKERESFTDVILRVASEKGNAAALLRVVKSMAPDDDLAEQIERASARLRGVRLRRARLTGSRRD